MTVTRNVANRPRNEDQTGRRDLRRRRLSAGVALGAALALLGLPTSAHAGPAGSAGKIAFASTETGNLEIWVMNADGSNRSVLTNHPAVDHDPDWSPNGKRIAFARIGDGIYTMNANGSEQKRVSVGRAPAWSPDGKRIALEAVGAGLSDILVVNADGTNLQNLTNTRDANEGHPTWSPDGRYIAFEKNGSDVWKMNADGSDPTYVGAGWSPAWSPDGANIAFSAFNNGDWDIGIMSPDGTNRHFVVWSGNENRPAWSPDGKKIAFDRSVLGEFRIFVMNADGTNRKNLTNDYVDDIGPSWQKAMPLPIAAPPQVKPGGPPPATPPPWSAQPGR